jgi:hypothetical protein
MRHRNVLRCALTAVVLLCAGSQARAEVIPWDYQVSGGPALSTSGSPGQVNLGGSSGSTTNNTVITVPIDPVSSGSLTKPSIFLKSAYTLDLTITDGPSKGTLEFSGVFNGAATKFGGLVVNQFTGPTTLSTVLDGHLYTAQISVNTPMKDLPIATSFKLSVTVQDAPEPSTLALAGVALSMFGAGLWRRRRVRVAA